MLTPKENARFNLENLRDALENCGIEAALEEGNSGVLALATKVYSSMNGEFIYLSVGAAPETNYEIEAYAASESALEQAKRNS